MKLRDIFSKFNVIIDPTQKWLSFINVNLKQAVAFCIRISSIVFTIFFVIAVLRWTGLLKEVRNAFCELQGLKIAADDPVIISRPAIPSYTNDYKDIDTIKNIIDKKLKEEKQ
jgi:hypothetical protein